MNHRQFARDVMALCEALEIERAIFCGASSGAMQLLTLALEAPPLAQALVLAGGTYFYSDEVRAWMGQLTPETFIGDVDVMRARHTAHGTQYWREVAEAFIALGTHAHTDDFPDTEALRAIKPPVLIVHGDRDQIFPVDVPVRLYELLPDAALCILPQTGHVLPVERPDWFNAIVLDFLARAAS